MSQTFRLTTPLRFAHCDSAGIAYYPRYFELCDAAVEDWTHFALGVTRRVLHMEFKLALPTVDLHATFSAPSYLGDLLEISLAVVRVGNSSVLLNVEVASDGQKRFRAVQTQVLTDMRTMKSQRWPAEWRKRLGNLVPKENLA